MYYSKMIFNIKFYLIKANFIIEIWKLIAKLHPILMRAHYASKKQKFVTI